MQFLFGFLPFFIWEKCPKFSKTSARASLKPSCLVLEAVFGVFWHFFSVINQEKINIKMRKQLTFF